MWNIGNQNRRRPEGTGVPQGKHDPKEHSMHFSKAQMIFDNTLNTQIKPNKLEHIYLSYIEWFFPEI